jgi:hypothetical protein
MKNIKGEEIIDGGFEQYIEDLEKLDQSLASQLEDRKKLLSDLERFFKSDKPNFSCPTGAFHSENGCVYPEKK